MSRRPELILFDAVHTLIEPKPRVLDVYQRCGEKHGCSLSRLDLGVRFSCAFNNASYLRQLERDGQTDEAGEHDFWRQVVQKVFEELAPDFVEAVLNELWEHFAEPHNWRLFDDVAPTFAELRRRGFPIGIASNFDSRLLAICDEHPELAGIDPIFVSSRLGWVKPSPGFYSEIERITRLQPDQILLIGDDQVNDVLVPSQLGWQTRWLQRFCPEDPASHLSRLTELSASID